MVNCPNGHPNPKKQRYCGQCGSPLPSQPRHLWRWLLITAASVTVVAVAAAVTIWLTSPGTNDRAPDGGRWSGFPHTMGCVPVQENNKRPDPSVSQVPLTDDVRVKQVMLDHPGGQRINLSVEFLESFPTGSSVRTGNREDAPGSIDYAVILAATQNMGAFARVSIHSPRGGYPWEAQVENGDHPDESPLTSTQVSEKTVTFTLDLDRQANRMFGTGPYTPSVLIVVSRNGNPDMGPMMFSYPAQNCPWDAPVTIPARSPPQAAAQPNLLPPNRPGGWGSPAQTQAPPAPQATSPSSHDGPVPAQGGIAFQSPSGNIACHMSPTGAACEIAQHEYAAPAPPTNCDIFGNRVALDSGGPSGYLACYSVSYFGPPLATQAYDTPLSSGPITCALNEQTGATCRDTTTGHFFRVSKQSYQVG